MGLQKTHTQKQKHTFCFHPCLFWFIQSLPSSAHLYSFPTHSTHFCQGSKDKLGPNRGPGRFQPKDKAGLVNFEEEQFLEVSWLLRLADRVWPGNRFLRSQPSASRPLQGKLVLPFPPFIWIYADSYTQATQVLLGDCCWWPTASFKCFISTNPEQVEKRQHWGQEICISKATYVHFRSLQKLVWNGLTWLTVTSRHVFHSFSP